MITKTFSRLHRYVNVFRLSFMVAMLTTLIQWPLVSKTIDVKANLLIVGATESGWAAAIQSARMGLDEIVIVHDGHWFGGQFTEQALACVDENKGLGKVGWGVDWHPMKRSFHRSGLFKELMDRVEAFNKAKYGLSMPGFPFHGPSTFHPKEMESIFRDMIQPYINAGTIQVFWQYETYEASVVNDRLQEVVFKGLADHNSEDLLIVEGKMTIDASDWGEVIKASGAAYECGPDPFDRYQEPSAPKDLSDNPSNEMNPITYPMILVETDEPALVSRPENFDDRKYTRSTRLSLAHYRDLEWDIPDPGLGAITHWPDSGHAVGRQLSIYTVRRIIQGENSKLGKTSILFNYMNGQDYPLERLPDHVVVALEANEVGASSKNIVRMNRTQRQIIFDDAKEHAKGLLYHLQNFVHEKASDTTHSFRNFVLSDEFSTDDHFPPKPYIREGLRLKSMYMMREQDARNTDGYTKDLARERFAQVLYPDGLFAWQFHYDFHRTGRTYLKSEGNAGPWIDYHKPNRHTNFLSDRSVFPMRSLIPIKMDGLLGAQGNVGFSSIVSAAVRLHDQRIHIGQAAGAVAVVSLKEQMEPREIVFQPVVMDMVIDGLCGEHYEGTPLLIWPWRDLPTDHPAFVAANRLSFRRILPMSPTEVDFQPDKVAQPSWLQATKRLNPQVQEWRGRTRGEVAMYLWNEVRGEELKSRKRLRPEDFDGDGISDVFDALLFTADEPIVWRVTK
ncbi:MAG: FAD-dependent oxidoreductase [Saprospiraceae bacterium]|nr:FAD-dependent oxidoreductase [Saprospiraceae bacterium]